MGKILSILILGVIVTMSSCSKETDMDPVISIEKLLIKPAIAMEAGDTEKLTVEIVPPNAPDKSVTWSVFPKDIITVDDNGWITAVNVGSATITVTSVADNTKQATCVVTVTPHSVAVGDYYYSDNSYSMDYNSAKTCIGIVFWIDPKDATRGKIVSLNEGETAWSRYINEDIGGKVGYENLKDEWPGDIHSVARKDGNLNGKLLYQYIAENRRTMNDYPAFEWCNTKAKEEGVDWYLPSLNEVQYLWCAYNGAVPVLWQRLTVSPCPAVNHLAKSTFNDKLEAVPGGMKISNYGYWTSTESNANDGWGVSFSDGETQGIIKAFMNYGVRAVATFKISV